MASFVFNKIVTNNNGHVWLSIPDEQRREIKKDLFPLLNCPDENRLNPA
jgi:hypothetical protein